MCCKRTSTGCLKPRAETSLRDQLFLQQYPGRLSKAVWERFLPPLSPHFTTTLSGKRQELMEMWGPPTGFVHQFCTGRCLRGLLWQICVERGRKRGLWPDGSIALSHSFRGMLWQSKLPPQTSWRSLRLRRKHNGMSHFKSPLPNTIQCTDNRSSKNTAFSCTDIN